MVVAALVTLNDQGICQKANIALGGVFPTPLRAKAAEAVLKGQKITEALIAKAAETAAEATEPESDYHASAEYRKEMARVFTGRALKEAWNLVKGGR